MTVNGIIAEYNPFHNGHLYQMEESRRLTGADYTVVVMSGDFVQRGAPALLRKHARAEMALRCGADLVMELPVLYAAASAEYFAAGAVALLDKLGVVTHLCFGSECGNAAMLRQLAHALSEEPEEYRCALRRFLKEGAAYPYARSRALAAGRPRDLPEGWEDILSSPNNLLGVEYIRALLKRDSPMAPVTVKRLGAGYHETMHGSALAIRQTLRQQGDSEKYEQTVHSDMPPEAAALLLKQLNERPPMHGDSLSLLLYFKLFSEREYGYEKYLDVSSDLSDRIKKMLGSFTGYEAFCQLLKTKNMTYSRISRCLLHILLGIEKEHMALGRSLDYAPYARILGFRKEAGPLLAAIKSRSSIPLVTKLAQGQKSLPEDACRLLNLDIRASGIYNGVLWDGAGCPAPSEFSTPLVLL